MNAKVVNYEERPLWFDIYKAFPPKREPVLRTVVSGDELPSYTPPKIIYYEDQIRSLVERFIKENLFILNKIVLIFKKILF